jgi:hypothetical protein
MVVKFMYDVIVIGGGHAGCEACLATSKMGLKTLLVTGNLNMVGSMPCNPSIGGPAKGVVVREIDALGGYQGKNADLCQIQTKMLNSSKGPAVRALRFQEDKILYMATMKKHLESVENLDLMEMYVEDLIVEDGVIKGIVLENGETINCKACVLTTGTFLDSRILRGHWTKEEGPDGQRTTKGLSRALERLGFEIQRLKTGTPARIKASTIKFEETRLEPGDDYTWHYSFDKGYDSILNVKVPCYLTYTNQEIHDLIMDNLKESAMYMACSVFIVVIGIALFIVWTVVRKKTTAVSNVFYLAILSIVYGLWSFNETVGAIIMLKDRVACSFAAFVLLKLLAPTLVLFAREFVGAGHGMVWEIASRFMVVEAVITISMHMLGIMDLKETVLSTHIILIFSMV